VPSADGCGKAKRLATGFFLVIGVVRGRGQERKLNNQ
jgi:hypothetical protein